MKLSRRQLRKIILLEMERQTADDVPSAQQQSAYFRRKAGIDPDTRQALRALGDDDEAQEHELAKSLGSQEASPQYINEMTIRKYAQRIEPYLPGFSNLPYPMMEVVVKYVFMTANPYMYTNIDFGTLIEEFGGNNVEEMSGKLRYEPKSYDPRFFFIYAVGSYGAGYDSQSDDEFDKIDPYGGSDGQAGFHDGFITEYQKVTTHPSFTKGKNPTNNIVKQFIKMMRELRPEVKEHVID